MKRPQENYKISAATKTLLQSQKWFCNQSSKLAKFKGMSCQHTSPCISKSCIHLAGCSLKPPLPIVHIYKVKILQSLLQSARPTEDLASELRQIRESLAKMQADKSEAAAKAPARQPSSDLILAAMNSRKAVVHNVHFNANPEILKAHFSGCAQHKLSAERVCTRSTSLL